MEQADISDESIEAFQRHLAEFLQREIEADEASRVEWCATYQRGLELLGLKLEPPTPDILSITRDIARGG